jgi:hypothetical protein
MMSTADRPSPWQKAPALLCPGCSRPMAHRQTTRTIKGRKAVQCETYECGICGPFEVQQRPQAR